MIFDTFKNLVKILRINKIRQDFPCRDGQYGRIERCSDMWFRMINKGVNKWESIDKNMCTVSKNTHVKNTFLLHHSCL